MEDISRGRCSYCAALGSGMHRALRLWWFSRKAFPGIACARSLRPCPGAFDVQAIGMQKIFHPEEWTKVTSWTW